MNSHSKLALITLALLGLVILISKKVNFEVSQTFTFDYKSIPNTLGIKINKESPLKKIVDKNIVGGGGVYAVYIEDLSVDGEVYSFNEQQIFPAASLYKLILIAAILNKVESGEYHLDERISANKKELEKVLGSKELGYENSPEAIIYTIDLAITRVLTISDNYAAIMLTQRLGDREKLNQMAKSLGMGNTKFKGEEGIETIALDIGIYFKKLYLGGVVSKNSSDKIIALLSKSKINDRIPAKLDIGNKGATESLKIAHKTGELPRIRHDSGIVFLEGNPYILVMLSKDLADEEVGVEVEAQLSKDIYEYFMGVSK